MRPVGFIAPEAGGHTQFVALGSRFVSANKLIKLTHSESHNHIGGQRVAMNDGGTVRYLLTDHLGSTALNISAGLANQGEVRYYAWGGDRYTSGSMPTSYRCTGQRSLAIHCVASAAVRER